MADGIGFELRLAKYPNQRNLRGACAQFGRPPGRTLRVLWLPRQLQLHIANPFRVLTASTNQRRKP